MPSGRLALRQPNPASLDQIRANWPHTAAELRRFAAELDRCEHNRPDAARIRLAVLLADQRYQELDAEGWPP